MDYKPRTRLHVGSILVKLSYSRWLPSRIRVNMLQKAGVNFVDKASVFIGSNVSFDTHYPNLITIEKGVQLTQGVKLITHSVIVRPPFRKHRLGRIKLGKNAFLGSGTIVLPDVEVGENTLVGAGSIINRNLDPNSLYVGNPIKKIKDITYE